MSERCGMCGAADCKYAVCESVPWDYEFVLSLCDSCVTKLFGSHMKARQIEKDREAAENELERVKNEKALKLHMKAVAKANRIAFLERKAKLESALEKAYGEP